MDTVVGMKKEISILSTVMILLTALSGCVTGPYLTFEANKERKYIWHLEAKLFLPMEMGDYGEIREATLVCYSKLPGRFMLWETQWEADLFAYGYLYFTHIPTLASGSSPMPILDRDVNIQIIDVQEGGDGWILNPDLVKFDLILVIVIFPSEQTITLTGTAGNVTD